MEKVYKTMRNAGVINIVIGSVIITAGVAAGVLAIISGACLLENSFLPSACPTSRHIWPKFSQRSPLRLLHSGQISHKV